jgi:cell division protein FtsW
MDDSIYRLRLQDVLALCVLGLLSVGVLMVQSAATNVAGRWVVRGTLPGERTPKTFTIDALGEGKALEWAAKQKLTDATIEPAEPKWDWNERGTKHAGYALGAVLVFFVVSRFDYRRLLPEQPNVWTSPAVWAMLIAAVLCAATLVPGIGHTVNGARRWIKFGPVQIQASELAKWAVVLHLAWWIALRPDSVKRITGLLSLLVPAGLLCLLVVIQDFGTAALVGVVSILMLLAGGARLRYFAVVIPPMAIAATLFVTRTPYRLQRMTSFLDPFADARGVGYHMVQSLLSFAGGGLGGRGLGNGVQKLGYLPEDTTDFIFAVVCEELGLFGAVLVMALFAGILFVAWRLVKRPGETFGRLMAFGIGAMITLQAIINVAVATVSVPTKGLSLPLVSAGGSGLLIAAAALGALASIARHPGRKLRPVNDEQLTPPPMDLTDAMLAQWTAAS